MKFELCSFLKSVQKILLIMRNVSDMCCRENQNTHFMFSDLFPIIVQFLRSSSSSLRVSRWLVYSSASLHLLIGRPRFLFPSGIPSCTFFTSRSSAILDTCSLHSVLLLCTQDVMFWISHSSLILSFRILSHFVLFIILLNVFISVTSSSCLVFAVSVRVSAA